MVNGSRAIAVAVLLTVAGRPAVQQPRQNVSSSSSSSSSSSLLFPDGLPANYSSDDAIDVQYTSCKIITDRIVATAEGKFSRFCHGICNINETNARLHRIESLLTTDAEYIKRRLFNLERIFADGGDNILSKSGSGDTGRLREVSAYNGTVVSATATDSGGVGRGGGGGGGGRATTFVYYWRVDAFWRLTFADGRARSRPFYVSPRGYRVALTVHSDVTARTVRVAAVPAAGEYDAQLRWPFAHPLRVSVLDQTDVAPEDIVSHVWDDVRCGPPVAPPPHQQQQQQQQQQHQQHQQHQQQQQQHRPTADVCASVEFRHDVLTCRRYTAGDALLVKLTVFLQ